MLFAMVWYTLLCVALNKIASGGGTNYMTPEVAATLTPESIVERIKGSKWAFASEHIFNLTLWSFKACMLILYFRLA